MAILRTSRRVIVPIGALLASAALAPSSRAATPPAPKMPGINTNANPQVSTTSVTFTGSVNPRGLATVYAFQFGTTSGYGAQTATTSVGSGTTEVKVSQTIEGLQPATSYHYRLVATNAAGTNNGHDFTFTTRSIPLTFALAAKPNLVVFGSPSAISGVLSGTRATNREVVLQANPFPYLGGFKTTTSTQLTSATGAFSFPVVDLTETTQFRVAVAGVSPVYSGVVVTRVAVRVSMNLRSTGRPGFVRMYGTVTPGVEYAPVAFQLIRRGRQPLTVASTTVKLAGAGKSRFSRVVRVRRRGLYRAFVQTPGGRRVSGYSRTVLIR
jgi:hypothetical protein